jgi:hypothetical protein
MASHSAEEVSRLIEFGASCPSSRVLYCFCNSERGLPFVYVCMHMCTSLELLLVFIPLWLPLSMPRFHGMLVSLSPQ